MTEIDKKILDLICQGFTTAEIAAKIARSTRTVEAHRASMCRYYHCRTMYQVLYKVLTNSFNMEELRKSEIY